jgi:hypothetical protein
MKNVKEWCNRPTRECHVQNVVIGKHFGLDAFGFCLSFLLSLFG